MKVVLAYSGGLDTSVILRWLIETHGAEVICYCGDVGQAEDLEVVAEKAMAIAADICVYTNKNLTIEELKAE